MRRLIPLMLLISLSPAAAQDQPPPNIANAGQGTEGGVARLVFAHQLYAWGVPNKDALAVLNAARIAASVTLTEAVRSPEPPPDTATASALPPITPDVMFDRAATLAAENETLLDLIDASRREVAYAPATVAISSTSTIPKAQAQTWALPFYGEALAEVAFIGNGNSNLDLKVTDENGNLVCQDVGPQDTAYCSFFPAQSGAFLITVNNVGADTNTYMLLTN